MQTELIKNINIHEENSWKDKIFLTFDLDWCLDETLQDTLDLLEKYDAKATFFVTHKTELLSQMRQNPNIELAIHPNFNFLLEGDFQQGKNINEIIEYYLKFVPDAVSVRSHSLTQGSKIVSAFEYYGLLYECNSLVPLSGGG